MHGNGFNTDSYIADLGNSTYTPTSGILSVVCTRSGHWTGDSTNPENYTYNGSIWVNGFIQSNSGTVSANGADFFPFANDFCIGPLQYGNLIMLGVWNRVLTDKEILSLYKEPFSLYQSSTRIFGTTEFQKSASINFLMFNNEVQTASGNLEVSTVGGFYSSGTNDFYLHNQFN